MAQLTALVLFLSVLLHRVCVSCCQAPQGMLSYKDGKGKEM